MVFYQIPKRNNFLKTDAHQELIVKGISDGIDKYFDGNSEKGAE